MWPSQPLSKFALLISQILAPSHSPSTCLSTPTTLEHLVDCFHPFTVPERKYPDCSSYDAAQPNATQRQAWSNVITAVLNVDGNCPIPPSVNTIMSIASFTEPSGTAFCVLYESSVESGHYAKGWGLSIVPELSADVSRCILFSALARRRWGHPTTSSFLVQGDRRKEPAHHWEEADSFSIAF